MKTLACEMCNSTNVLKKDGVYICQSCGTKYSVEEARKMMVDGLVEVVGTVEIDSSKELTNLYQIARRAKNDDNSENAQKYYDMILVKDPNNWEANFYVVYFKAMSCKVAEIWNAANSISNSIDTVLQLVKENVTDLNEQRDVIEELYLRLSIISNMLYVGATNHYEGIDESIKYSYIQEYVNNAAAATDIMYIAGDQIEAIFDDIYGGLCATAWEKGIEMHNGYIKLLQDKVANKQVILNYVEKVKKYNSTYQVPFVDTSSGGCYIATVVYGSYDCSQVWTLRRFRDNILDKTWYGRGFIYIYYAISPILVKWFGNMNLFKIVWQLPLDILVNKLQSKGIKDTPYYDKY